MAEAPPLTNRVTAAFDIPRGVNDKAGDRKVQYIDFSAGASFDVAIVSTADKLMETVDFEITETDWQRAAVEVDSIRSALAVGDLRSE